MKKYLLFFACGLLLCNGVIVTDAEAKKNNYVSEIIKRLFGRATVKNYKQDKDYDTDALSVEELEKCVRLGIKIDTMESDTEEKENAVSLKLFAIEKIESKINELDIYLQTTPYSEQQVLIYNERVDSRNALANKYSVEINLYEKLLNEYNGKVGLYNNEVNKFEISCQNKKYYEEDMKIVEAKLQEFLR